MKSTYNLGVQTDKTVVKSPTCTFHILNLPCSAKATFGFSPYGTMSFLE